MSRLPLKTLVVVSSCLLVGGLALASQVPSQVLRLERGDHVFQVVIEPGQVAVGHGVTMTLELNRVPKVPDPTFGDRVPVRGASLVAVVAPESDSNAKVRYAMHPLAGAGTYGFHWTPESRGMYTLAFERRDGKIPEVEFKVGVGVKTPKQDDADSSLGGGGPGLHRARIHDGAAVIGPLTPNAAGPTAKSLMKGMTDAAGVLSDAFRHRPMKSTIDDAVATLAAQAKKLPGTVPDKYRVAASDYDAMAKQLQSKLADLASTADAGHMRKAGSQWRDIVDNTCTRCHVKFWWAVTPDLGSWPRVEAQTWRR